MYMYSNCLCKEAFQLNFTHNEQNKPKAKEREIKMAVCTGSNDVKLTFDINFTGQKLR